MKKVLVPVAVGEMDAKTLGFAKEFSVNLGAQLCVVSVLPYSNIMARPQVAHFAGVERDAFVDVCDEVIAQITRQLADAGITNVTTAILKGDPASEIIDYAEKEGCDLILMHTRGMSLAKRFTMGSVTNNVVHHANVPVFVVK